MRAPNEMPTFDALFEPLLAALRALGGSGSIEEIYAKTVEIADTFKNIDELDSNKLNPLLKRLYNNSLHDAMTDLGDAVQVRQAFVGMQRYLYAEKGI